MTPEEIIAGRDLIPWQDLSRCFKVSPRGMGLRASLLVLVCTACAGPQKRFPNPQPAPVIGVTNTGPMPVYVLAGQSNAAGGGEISQLTAEQQAVPEGAMIYCAGPRNYYSEDPSLLGRWSPLIAGDGNNLTYCGPELGFAQSIPSPAHLIKYTVCGTSMDTFWRSPSAGGAFPGYVGLLEAVRDGLACADIPGGQHIAGLLWLQGESDAPDGEAAANYADRMAAFISDFRAAVNEPTMPVVVAQIHTLPVWTYGVTVQGSQASMATIMPNVGTFSTMDIPVPSATNPHFEGPEQIEVGQRFAATMLALTPD